MDIVTTIIGAIDDAIESAGQTMFENISSGLGGIIIVAITLMLIFFGLAMSFGMKRMSMDEIAAFIMRAVLILIFAQSWTHFSTFYDVLTNAFGDLALSFFKTATDNTASSVTSAMDRFAGNAEEVTDDVISAQGAIARGVLGALSYVALLFLMGAYIFVVALAKIVVAICLGLAPFAIMMTAFSRTQNLFESWLSSLVAYLMYPVAAAGVVGTIFLAADAVFKGDTATGTLAGISAYMVIIVVGILALTKIPNVAHGLTGQFQLAAVTPGALAMGGKMLAAPLGWLRGQLGNILAPYAERATAKPAKFRSRYFQRTRAAHD